LEKGGLSIVQRRGFALAELMLEPKGGIGPVIDSYGPKNNVKKVLRLLFWCGLGVIVCIKSTTGQDTVPNNGKLINLCHGPTNFIVSYQLAKTLSIQMTMDANRVAHQIIHTPDTNGWYDIFGTTNLGSFVPPFYQTKWTWLQRVKGTPTNFVWTNVTPCEAWFQLGTMQDDDGDGITTAYQKLVAPGNPNKRGTNGYGLAARAEWLERQRLLAADTNPPTIHIVNPREAVLAQKIIQLDGYCPQKLDQIRYTVYTNGTMSDSGMGYVTDQTYDRARRDFTTNFFRCYDLFLAEGLNTIVVEVVNTKRKTNSVSVNYKVDFHSDTNAPSFKLLWPPNGSAVSDSSFTMNGIINNPSASIRASITSANKTNEFFGIVSGSGGEKFWVPDVTLFPGTNIATIVATSPGGHSATSSVTLMTSTVTPVTDSETAANITHWSMNISPR
jgi:hypothetical protein